MKTYQSMRHVIIPEKAPALLRAQLVAFAYIRASHGEPVLLHDTKPQAAYCTDTVMNTRH